MGGGRRRRGVNERPSDSEEERERKERGRGVIMEVGGSVLGAEGYTEEEDP